MKLFLENVRSFEGWHEIPIAPATVLLGENSAGKSTLLGMLSVVHNEGFPFSGNFFNQFPFEFGGYKTLACSKKRVEHFSIGISIAWQAGHSGLIAAFREEEGLPVLCHVFVWCVDVGFVIYEQGFGHLNRAAQLGLTDTLKVKSVELSQQAQHGIPQMVFWNAMLKLGTDTKGAAQSSDFSAMITALMDTVLSTPKQALLAFAPNRSRPKRTYDQLSDEFSSEGDHVPLMLARATDPNNKQAAALHEATQSFGKYSEMFSDIGVKQLGRGSGDPFQVQVKVGTKQTNLMDVGYGVSQVLPLIVDAQRASSNTTLLLQQPEVHLHPKAQAALGSMVKDWVSKNKKTVVVETHSDYLVDRLRLEVKRKNLKESDLKIFFLEKRSKKDGESSNTLKIDGVPTIPKSDLTLHFCLRHRCTKM
jgi:energy-coupling factor transporter ATP-binding protein EcfA2